MRINGPSSSDQALCYRSTAREGVSRHPSRFSIATLAFLLLAVALGLDARPVGADSIDAPCSDLTLLFARGSDQYLTRVVRPQDEPTSYLDRLESRLPGYTVNKYELGSETHGGYRYRAFGIATLFGASRSSFARIVNSAITSILSAILRGRPFSIRSILDDMELDLMRGMEALDLSGYDDSVTGGVAEMIAYLEGRAARCQDEVFAVGGYSQGAHVVGQGMFGLAAETRERIAHVALFADPKLRLPEGERAESVERCVRSAPGAVSVWRRGDAACSATGGVLNRRGLRGLDVRKRDPYLPPDIATRSGSWCDHRDGVCTGSLLDLVRDLRFDAATSHFHFPAHGIYPQKYFAEAAAEAATRLEAAMATR